MIEIKLCGLKEPTHLKAAYNLGVKYVGFVFFENSKRFLNNETAKSLISHTHPNIIKVGLVVNPNDVLLKSISDLGLDMVQLHGSESVSRVKEIRSKGVNIVIGPINNEDFEEVKKFNDIIFISPSNINPEFQQNVISIGISFESQMIALAKFIKKQKKKQNCNSYT